MFLVPCSWFRIPDSMFWLHVADSMFLIPCSWLNIPDSLSLVQCFWFHVLGSMFLVPCSWFNVPGSMFLSMFLVPCSWFHLPGSMFWVQCSWFHVPGSMFLIPSFSKVTRFFQHLVSGYRFYLLSFFCLHLFLCCCKSRFILAHSAWFPEYKHWNRFLVPRTEISELSPVPRT